MPIIPRVSFVAFIVLSVALLVAVLAPLPAWAGFSVVTADSTGDVGDGAALALHTAAYGGLPAIAYLQHGPDGSHEVRCAEPNTDGWEISTISSADDVAPAIATDGAGVVHIVYSMGGSLWHAYRSRWTSLYWDWEPIVCNAYGPFRGLSMVSDRFGQLHVSYEDDGGLMYVARSAGGWACERVVGYMGHGDLIATSVAADTLGDPHIAFYKAFDIVRFPAYAHRTSTGWSYVSPLNDYTVHSSVWVTSLTLDSAGRSHVAYSSGPDLSAIWVLDGGVWSLEAPLPSGCDPRVSLAVDPAGRLCVLASRSGELLYCVYQSGAWSEEVIGTICGYSMDEWFALRLAPDGAARAAYYDQCTADLRFASRNWFTDMNVGLPGVSSSAAAWGDYDGDGDLDLVLTGYTGSTRIARIYRNDAGAFIDVAAGLPGVSYSSVAWGDYDNDGDLDLALTGYTGSTAIARIYRNDAGAFTDVAAGLPGVWGGAVAWGDYDNDGDLDLALTGSSLSLIYRNDAGVFTDVAAGLRGVSYSSVAWGDYDNDGDLDLLLTGDFYAEVYRNDRGSFTFDVGFDTQTGVSGEWGDYDADGDLDILISSGVAPECRPSVFRNDGGGVFINIGAELPSMWEDLGSRGAWGDYDNDGDLDLVLSGMDIDAVPITRVYRNDGGVFYDISAGLRGVMRGSVSWGDYNGDGSLDLLVTGSGQALVYGGNSLFPNTAPTVPTNLNAYWEDDHLLFRWDASTDAQTPPAALSYNLRIGTTPGGGQIVSPMADPATGQRRVVQLGNTQERTSWPLSYPLPVSHVPPPLYWSVQAVDGSYAGSPFADEQVFTTSDAVESDLPHELSFVLRGANPVARVAQFRFGLPGQARVDLTIHDVAGREVVQLVHGEREPGFHTVNWRAGEAAVGSGVYFARLAVNGRVLTRRLVVLR